MTKGPAWMPLDVGDYLKDTHHLQAHEHGAYLLLIMRYWQDGGLPADERMIARYSKLTPEQWAESRDIIAAFFDANWKHKRIDAEIAKAEDIIAKRRSAAEKRYKPDASAEQEQSKSSYTRVPPSPLPEPREENQASVPSGQRVRKANGHDQETYAEFEEVVWADFPRHPNSRKDPAFKAYEKLPMESRAACIRGVMRYAQRFKGESDPKRTEAERLRYVPHLVTWINQKGWENELERQH